MELWGAARGWPGPAPPPRGVLLLPLSPRGCGLPGGLCSSVPWWGGLSRTAPPFPGHPFAFPPPCPQHSSPECADPVSPPQAGFIKTQLCHLTALTPRAGQQVRARSSGKGEVRGTLTAASQVAQRPGRKSRCLAKMGARSPHPCGSPGVWVLGFAPLTPACLSPESSLGRAPRRWLPCAPLPTPAPRAAAWRRAPSSRPPRQGLPVSKAGRWAPRVPSFGLQPFIQILVAEGDALCNQDTLHRLRNETAASRGPDSPSMRRPVPHRTGQSSAATPLAPSTDEDIHCISGIKELSQLQTTRERRPWRGGTV